MRPLICEIRLNHLRDNYLELKKISQNKLLAVVKANAYGHGAVECALALRDIADGFAVACLEEAVELRQAGINNPIVLLEGVFEAQEYDLVEQLDLWAVIHHQAQLEQFLAHSWQKPTTVWLKMDSGMHRAGFFPHNYAAAYTALQHSPFVKNIIKMTHLYDADGAEPHATERQLETFQLACDGLDGETSISNSAGILRYPQARCDWARAGLALYGVSPVAGLDAPLKPVMRLSSRIFAERVLQPHEPIGYGATFFTQRSTRVGLVACGYGDGYPRLASTHTPIAVKGERTRIIGRVSMDMLTVDLPDSHEGVGDEVELFGDIVSVNEVARAAGTIAYEVLCHIKRAKRIYLK